MGQQWLYRDDHRLFLSSLLSLFLGKGKLY